MNTKVTEARQTSCGSSLFPVRGAGAASLCIVPVCPICSFYPPFNLIHLTFVERVFNLENHPSSIFNSCEGQERTSMAQLY